MTTTADPKVIQYSRLDHDYSAFYDGEFIGAYPTYHAAERALDDHALYLLESGLDRTATELDGGCAPDDPCDMHSPCAAHAALAAQCITAGVGTAYDLDCMEQISAAHGYIALPDGLRLAQETEAGWFYKTPTGTFWVTD